MEKGKSTQTLIIAVLAVALLVMAVGYARFTQTLKINGTAKAVASNWSIIWDQATFSQAGDVTLTKASSASVGENQYFIDTTNTTVTYNVTLPQPGTYYEMTINAKNAGTIDANLTSITLTTPTTEAVTYTVTYNGTEYTATTSGLTIPLAAGASHAVKVKVEYPMPANTAGLLSEDATMTLTAAFGYAQDESSN